MVTQLTSRSAPTDTRVAPRPSRRSTSLAWSSAAFLAEAAAAYAWRLHYYSSAVLLGVIGIAVLAVTGRRGRQPLRAVAWLLVTFPAGAAAEPLLGLTYQQRF